jgi:hypothetical protein
MPYLQFGPFTPDFSQILHRLEIDLRGFLQNFTGTGEVGFSLASSATVFVEA